MKKNIILLFVFLLYNSVYGQTIDLAVSDIVNVTKTTTHELIPETQLFFIKPNELVFNKNNNRYEANENVFITVYNYQNNSISKEIIGFKESVKRSESRGAIPFYLKEFLLGGNKAIIMYGNSEIAGLETIMLETGNTTNSFLLKGYFPAQNQQIRDEVLKSILTTYVDNSIKLDVQYKYSIDLSKSQFKLNQVDGLAHYYTIPGKGDLKKNYMQNQVIIQALPAYPTFEARKEYNDTMMERFKTSLKISALIENEVVINGLRGLESSYITSSNGTTTKNYQLIIGNDNETIFLSCIAFTNKDIAFSQFKEMVKTLKLK